VRKNMGLIKKKEIKLIFNQNDVNVIALFDTKRKFVELEYFKKGRLFYISQIIMPNLKIGSDFIKNFDSIAALDIINFNYNII
jgi:hypothetical protein